MKQSQWNRLADDFESEVCDITREEASNRIVRFVNAARVPARNSLLVDLGCGLGTFVSKFGGRFTRVIALDHARRIVDRAKAASQSASPVRWMVLDVAEAGSVLGPCADLTVCMNVVTASNEERRAELWRSVAMVTKPRGYTLIVVPSIESDHIVQRLGTREGRADEYVSSTDGIVQRDGALQKHYSRDELGVTLSSLGFAVKRMGRANYPWSVEGLRKPASRSMSLPWDWMCLAQKSA